jgi:hypothetical protein
MLLLSARSNSLALRVRAGSPPPGRLGLSGGLAAGGGVLAPLMSHAAGSSAGSAQVGWEGGGLPSG